MFFLEPGRREDIMQRTEEDVWLLFINLQMIVKSPILQYDKIRGGKKAQYLPHVTPAAYVTQSPTGISINPVTAFKADNCGKKCNSF